MTAVMLLVVGRAAPLQGQDMADFDYENLEFRGVGLEWGWLWPNNVASTPSYGLRMDLGYLGPGLRVVPSLTYWSSTMKRSVVARLEERLEGLVAREQPPGSPPPDVSLGTIGWSDLSAALDAHVVWRAPRGLLTFAGGGAAVHFLNGSGDAIVGTFIEDLLDDVSAGFNVQAGAEYPLTERLRPYVVARLELLEDIHYAALRGGLQIMTGSASDAEGPR
jgi:hypothetical protein